MEMFEGGVIDAAPLHQGADLFLPLLEKWTAMEDYEPVDGQNFAEGLRDLDPRTRCRRSSGD